MLIVGWLVRKLPILPCLWKASFGPHLSQLNPFHTLFLFIQFCLGPQVVSYLRYFSAFLISTMRATCLFHLIFPSLHFLITFCEEFCLRSSAKSKFLLALLPAFSVFRIFASFFSQTASVYISSLVWAINVHTAQTYSWHYCCGCLYRNV
jgi:hypothetical protein